MNDATLPLNVRLAGYNVDRDTLDQLAGSAYNHTGDTPPREALTPETISAAYARISRNPAAVGELRAKSRFEVERARKSNENIVFGLGHSSVAEHAAFNVDVVGISRLGVEAVERHRLVSFTEKSQRYIKLDGDFVLPPEIRDTGLTDLFLETIQRQNDAYFTLYPKLLDWFTDHYTKKGAKNPAKAAAGKASEDARYVVGLATQAQFGMTLNARTLEMVIRDGLAHPLNEVKEFARQLYEEVKGIAPSLIKYVEATDYERDQFRRAAYWPEDAAPVDDLARLVDVTRDGEARVLAAMQMNATGCSWDEAQRRVNGFGREEREALIRDIFRHGAPWDPPPREFELADFTFELILSAAAFGQLKRHRMATQITGPYDPSLGWTIPDSVHAVDGKPLFDEVMESSAEAARTIAKTSPAAAAYALTNAHRRRVLFKANGREMYHVSRLREDVHAQWDIRRIAGKMLDLARAEMPVLLTMAVGKHKFDSRRSEVFGDDES